MTPTSEQSLTPAWQEMGHVLFWHRANLAIAAIVFLISTASGFGELFFCHSEYYHVLIGWLFITQYSYRLSYL